MSTACLLSVIACGSAAHPTAGSTVCSSLTTIVNVRLPIRLQRDRGELRADYRSLLRSADRRTTDPFAITPKLVSLYVELSEPGALPYGERKVKYRALRLRLLKMHNRLAPIADGSRRIHGTRPVGRHPESAAGGAGTLARARQLIRLIRSVIAPESWDVNGGDNSIQFYAPLNVLVVRASGEVHHQIGGVLPALKP